MQREKTLIRIRPLSPDNACAMRHGHAMARTSPRAAAGGHGAPARRGVGGSRCLLASSPAVLLRVICHVEAGDLFTIKNNRNTQPTARRGARAFRYSRGCPHGKRKRLKVVQGTGMEGRQEGQGDGKVRARRREPSIHPRVGTATVQFRSRWNEAGSRWRAASRRPSCAAPPRVSRASRGILSCPLGRNLDRLRLVRLPHLCDPRIERIVGIRC